MQPTPPIDTLSDTELAAQVAETVSLPRRDQADSFVLHAPLELTARTALLPFVAPELRATARQRLGDIASSFEAFGPPIDAEPPDPDAFDLESAAARLVAAIGAGDVDAVDAPAAWLGASLTPGALADVLAAEVLPRLGAAAHAPILLFHLPRVAARGELSGQLLRPLVRELARQPEARLRWIEQRSGDTPAPGALTDAIAGVASRGRPDIDFIAPTMERVDDAQTAKHLAHLVGGVDIAARGRELLRVAARTMLIEPADFAPYIWTHCLTLPQAALGCAPHLPDPSLALSVAASHVVGFRSGFASRPLDAELPTSDTAHENLARAIAAGPDDAAAWVRCAADPMAAITDLATAAAAHPDAHHAKYTLACLDAAADDRLHGRLFLAAAAKLTAVWRQRDEAS